MVVVPKLREFRVRQEGDRVHVIVDGQVVLDLQWDAAELLWKALREKTLRAEEVAKATVIARDSAILLRAGARLVLSRARKIVDEAVKMAGHDRDLRRYMPLVKSQESFGHPVVINKAARIAP
jgi:hypothetical protein